jgi:hypothetical protein
LRRSYWRGCVALRNLGGGVTWGLRNCMIYRLLFFTLELSKQEILDERSM